MGSASTRTAAEIMAKGRQLAAEAEERLKLKAEAEKLEEEYVKCDALEVLNVKQVQFPFWPDDVRRMSNAVLRGALFSVTNDRVVFKNRTLIASVDGIEIRFFGTRHNQTILDVWEVLLHIARVQPLGEKVAISAGSLLELLGRGKGNAQYEQLKDEMIRLRSGTVEITWINDKKTFVGGLISSFYRDEKTQEYVLSLDKSFDKLYSNGTTEIDWDQRKSLGRNNVAKWLHGFYSTHEVPYPYKVATLQRLCGSVSSLSEFRARLRDALKKLVDIRFLQSWNIDAKSDLVSVKKKLKLKS